MTYAENLVRRIEAHLENGAAIPADLFFEALGAGLDVDAIERNFENNQ